MVDVVIDTVKVFTSMQASASVNIRRFVDCFQFEADGATRKMKVFEKLKKVDGLINDQMSESWITSCPKSS